MRAFCLRQTLAQTANKEDENQSWDHWQSVENVENKNYFTRKGYVESEVKFTTCKGFLWKQ
jgi:hypothetical protein